MKVGCEGYYCTAEEVLQYLKIKDYSQDDVDFLNNIIIPQVCDEIDELAGSAWRKCSVKDEYHRMGYPVPYGFWLVARPVYLRYFPVTEITNLEVWQGGNDYQNFTNSQQGRLGRWWLVGEEGILWINWMWWYAGRYDVKVSYNYGYYIENDDGSTTPNPDGKVKMLSIFMSAYRFLDSERYSNRVADNISDPNTYITQMNRLKKEIEALREWIKGMRVVDGGQI